MLSEIAVITSANVAEGIRSIVITLRSEDWSVIS